MSNKISVTEQYAPSNIEGSESSEEDIWTFTRIVKEKPKIDIVRGYFKAVASEVEDEVFDFV